MSDGRRPSEDGHPLDMWPSINASISSPSIRSSSPPPPVSTRNTPEQIGHITPTVSLLVSSLHAWSVCRACDTQNACLHARHRKGRKSSLPHSSAQHRSPKSGNSILMTRDPQSAHSNPIQSKSGLDSRPARERCCRSAAADDRRLPLATGKGMLGATSSQFAALSVT